MFTPWLAATLLVAVIVLIIWRPRKLAVMWPAVGGAALALLFGLLPLATLRTIFGDTWDATLTLIALFLLAEALERNGFFTWAALRLARLAGGSGARLYLWALALTAGVTALLANDGAVLMLTPVFATLLRAIYPNERARLPVLFAGGFFADALSGIFIPSNLTNIIVADANGLSVARSALVMALPTLGALLAGGGAFALRFRRELTARYDATQMEDPATAIIDPLLFRAGWVALGWLVVGYFIGSFIHLPVALVAGTAAVALVALTKARGVRRIREIAGAAPWDILCYALGMFAVITAAFDSGALVFVVAPLRSLAAPGNGGAGIIGLGGLAALLAALVNNLPATLIGVLALRHVPRLGAAALYALMLGVDIGPKLTPYGSLATLLWLEGLRRKDITISWGLYLRENWWVALVTLAAALGGLALVHRLFGI